jgi:hypothetical protein
MQVSALNGNNIKGITTTAIAALSSDQISALSSDALAGMSAAQKKLLPGSATGTSTMVGSSGGLQINLQWGDSTASSPAGFRDAVIAAAKSFTDSFSNPAVINIKVGYGEVKGSSIPTGALGASTSVGAVVDYATVRNALAQKAGNSSYQTTEVNHLPGSSPVSGSFYVSSAEMKALGLSSGSGTSIDGWIGLSSSYQSQFTGAAAANKFDAVAAMQHEISEVMGRTGSLGHVYGNGIYTVMDLYRYKGDNPSNPLSGNPVRDTTAGSSGAVFSIDGGATNLGFYNGSNGSSDYADWSPTMLGDSFGESAPGLPYSMSANDLVSMTALGYNLTSAGSAVAQAIKAYQSV